MLIGVIMFGQLLSPAHMTERFLQRVERLAGFKLVGNTFVRVGEPEELIRTDVFRLTPRESAAQLEMFGDFCHTLQFSPRVAALEWGAGLLRRVSKQRGPLVVLSAEEVKENKVNGVGWEVGKGSHGLMVDAKWP